MSQVEHLKKILDQFESKINVLDRDSGSSCPKCMSNECKNIFIIARKRVANSFKKYHDDLALRNVLICEVVSAPDSIQVAVSSNVSSPSKDQAQTKAVKKIETSVQDKQMFLIEKIKTQKKNFSQTLRSLVIRDEKLSKVIHN